MTQPCFLYRHYNADRRLLYVGISLSAVTRLQQHILDAEWTDQIADIEIVRYPNKARALAAERWAIQTEAPIYNRYHRIALPSNVEVGAAVRFTLEEAYQLAERGEVFNAIEPVEFSNMSRSEKRMHRKRWKHLVRRFSELRRKRKELEALLRDIDAKIAMEEGQERSEAETKIHDIYPLGSKIEFEPTSSRAISMSGFELVSSITFGQR